MATIMIISCVSRDGQMKTIRDSQYKTGIEDIMK
jgi:hypothetical protein